VAYSLLVNNQLMAVTDRAAIEGATRLPAQSRVSLVEFNRNYDGPSTLRFRVVGDYRPRPPYNWSAGSEVQLLNTAGTILFIGRLSLPRVVAHQNNYAMEWTARDRSTVTRTATAAAPILPRRRLRRSTSRY